LKKAVIILLLALSSAGAFAQLPMSAGGGVFMDMSFFNGYKLGDINLGYRNLGCSGYGFFDVRYAELGIGFGYGLMSKVVKKGVREDTPNFGDLMQLDLSVLAKYPFDFGSLAIFPLFGVSYKCVLYAKEPTGSPMPKKKELNQLGLLGGIGLDYDFNDTLYFRTEGLFHFRFPMKFVKDNLPSGASITSGSGGRIKVCIGYRLPKSKVL
jgi:hypothetical protein